MYNTQALHTHLQLEQSCMAMQGEHMEAQPPMGLR